MQNSSCAEEKIQLKTTWFEKILLLIGVFFSLVSIEFYFFDQVQFKNSILNLFLFIAISLLIFKSYSVKDKKLFRVSAIGAVLMSVMLILGNSIYRANNLSYVFGSGYAIASSILVFAGFFVFLTFGIKLGLYYIVNLKFDTPLKNHWNYFGSNKRSLLTVWILIFICWLPCYLAYFPGVFSYDIAEQTKQVLGMEPFDRFQTTTHTFFVKFCFELGSLFGGVKVSIIAYSIIQMLIQSFVYSLTIWYMAKLQIHKGIRIAALVFFACNPILALFSFIPTKDVMFTSFFILLTLLLIDVVRKPEKFFHSYLRQLALCVVLIFSCLFRSNAVYAMILFFICFVLFYKKYLINVLFIFGTFIISLSLITGPIYTSLGVKEGKVREALSVPIQQVASVAVKHDDELSQDEKDTIAEILNYNELKNDYNPRISDGVKRYFSEDNFKMNPVKYFKLWASLFVRYPGDYIDSVLSLNLGYWYPDNIHPDQYAHRIYIETHINSFEEFYFERESVFPGLHYVYEGFSSGQVLQHIPVVSLFFSIGFPIWFVFFCILILFAKKKQHFILVLLPAVFIWMSFMAGPVSNLRYIYHIMAAYPIYFALVLQSDVIDTISSPSEKWKWTKKLKRKKV